MYLDDLEFAQGILSVIPWVIGVIFAWAIICAIATACIDRLAKDRGCSEQHGAGIIFITCFFLSPIFSLLLVGFTPSTEYEEEDEGSEQAEE